MKKISLISLTIASLISVNTWAGTYWGWDDDDPNYRHDARKQREPIHWVGSVSLGAAWEDAGQTQTFFLTPFILKTYKAEKENNSFLAGEIFVGLQQAFSTNFLARWGLALAATDDADLQGVIWNDADPQFDNHTYSYKVQNTRLALKGTFLFNRFQTVKPWVSGSLGLGFNRAHSFNNTPKIFPAIKNTNFADDTKLAFAYSLGIGFQTCLYQNWELGIGYEFADLGKSQLAKAPRQTLNSGLSLSHLYTNGIMVNLTLVV